MSWLTLQVFIGFENSLEKATFPGELCPVLVTCRAVPINSSTAMFPDLKSSRQQSRGLSLLESGLESYLLRASREAEAVKPPARARYMTHILCSLLVIDGFALCFTGY